MRVKFSGRVYDGPLEGEVRESDRPWFEVPLPIPNPVFSYGLDNLIPASIRIEMGFYRWSHPIRAWVFLWDNKPSRYAYTG